MFGAAAASGVLLGLDVAQLRRAFGIACSRASGTRANFGTDTKPLHAGLAARAGLEAAELAARGVTAREDALEMSMGLADLYGAQRPVRAARGSTTASRSSGPGVELKPYPSCRFTHRAIDAVLALREKHAGRELRAIECESDPLGLKILIYPEPRTGLEAKFSLQYCVAVAWLDGWPGLGAFSDARAAPPTCRRCCGAWSCASRARRRRAGRARVRRRHARARDRAARARKSRRTRSATSERVAKAMLCVEPALGAARRARLDRRGRLAREGRAPCASSPRSRVTLSVGVWDALSAKLAERAGFELLFVSGFAVAGTQLGEPDFGLLTQTEMLETARRVVRAVHVPVIVDGDTGHGGPLNVQRVVRELVAIGASGVLLEDQVWPKRCGHMRGKEVIPAEEHVQKIRAAVEARGAAKLTILGRTDARAPLGLDEAIRRGRMYREAGADLIFVEAPLSRDELARIGREVPGPADGEHGRGREHADPRARRSFARSASSTSCTRSRDCSRLRARSSARSRSSRKTGVAPDETRTKMGFDEFTALVGLEVEKYAAAERFKV